MASSEDVNAQVLKQIEFYFSDSNFRHDKFLQAEAAKDEAGFVMIDVLLTFKRLQSITTRRPFAPSAPRARSLRRAGRAAARTAPRART